MFCIFRGFYGNILYYGINNLNFNFKKTSADYCRSETHKSYRSLSLLL